MSSRTRQCCLQNRQKVEVCSAFEPSPVSGHRVRHSPATAFCPFERCLLLLSLTQPLPELNSGTKCPAWEWKAPVCAGQLARFLRLPSTLRCTKGPLCALPSQRYTLSRRKTPPKTKPTAVCWPGGPACSPARSVQVEELPESYGYK